MGEDEEDGEEDYKYEEEQGKEGKDDEKEEEDVALASGYAARSQGTQRLTGPSSGTVASWLGDVHATGEDLAREQ